MKDFRQDIEIDNARRDSARRDADLSVEIRGLRRKVEHLQLVSRALCELLSENTEIDINDIVERIQDVDLRDGTANGKLVRPVVECPKCNRPVKTEQPKCLYCGAMLVPEDPLDRFLL